MNAIKWISAEAKKIKRAHPKKYKKWTQYIREASNKYAREKKPTGRKKAAPRRRRLGVSTVPAGLPLYSPRKKVMAGVRTTSRTHTDKNRITANIQIGSRHRPKLTPANIPAMEKRIDVNGVRSEIDGLKKLIARMAQRMKEYPPVNAANIRAQKQFMNEHRILTRHLKGKELWLKRLLRKKY